MTPIKSEDFCPIEDRRIIRIDSMRNIKVGENEVSWRFECGMLLGTSPSFARVEQHCTFEGVNDVDDTGTSTRNNLSH